MTTTSQGAPRTNLTGLRDHWRNDVIAGFSVSLVALPLAIGIAMAGGAPPIAGLVSVLVAGFLATFLRGSHVAINGPGNSLIVIVAAALSTFDGADAFPHVLGAVVVAGGIQIAFGVLRLGKLGDMIPGSVIQGMLAAIGLIIIGKQLHVLMGTTAQSSNAIDAFLELPQSIAAMNPLVAFIGVISLVVLVVHPRIDRKLVHFIPAPLWVALIAIGLDLAVAALLPHVAVFRQFPIGEALVVQVPADLLGSLMHPDFSRVSSAGFWTVVVTITLVTSIENIVSVKAVDKLDPYRRPSNMDRDLVGMGVSTIASGFLGGLPVLTVIARSSVGLNHGARTGWANFFQAVALLLMIVLLAPVLSLLPLGALAAILVYTGYRLTRPKVIRETLAKGPEYFLVFCATIYATLSWGLLQGIAVGIATEVGAQLVILGFSPRDWTRRVFGTAVESIEDDPLLLRVTGVASFLSIGRMRRALDGIGEASHVIVDFSGALLVDHTMLDYTHERGRRFVRDAEGRVFDVIGLEAHRALSDHPDALHALPLRERGLTKRQERIRDWAAEHEWEFEHRRDWEPRELERFRFFAAHSVEYRDAEVRGRLELDDDEVDFALFDLTFDEGGLVPDVYHTTAVRLELPVDLPDMVLEKEELLDRVLERVGYQDAGMHHFTKMSRKFVVKGFDREALEALMTPELVTFLEGETEYHLEIAGRDLLVFKHLRLASPPEVETMLDFSRRLVQQLMLQRKQADSGKHAS